MQQRAGDVEASGQQAFDQIEIAVKADVDLRIDAAGNRQQRDQHAEQQQQDQGPEKIRDREQDADAAVDQPIRRAGRARWMPVSAAISAEHDRDQRRQQRQFERRRQPRQHQLEDALVQADRTAEIAAQRPGRAR